ncbi:Mpo1-like protein [Halopseudomonas sp.]|uniref:Mpo1-like protein n=1 Tax=Halopseudomonas sp. TaxID=2901191 RepID=UPI0035687330
MAQTDSASPAGDKEFQSFAEFYPFYLSEHANDTSRRLHYIGSLLVLSILAWAVLTQSWLLLIALPLAGYGFAWVGHFFFEKNRPATFKYPLYSFLGDWVMLKDALTGRIRF